MIKGLVVSAIVVLGIAAGCAQQDVRTDTVRPNTPAPTSAPTTSTSDSDRPTPERASPTVASAQETPVAPALVPAAGPQRVGFVPLDDPTFLSANETEYFGDDELVLGVEMAGEYRAYPVRMLRYHHIVNDTVGGEPLLVTY